MAPCYLDHLLWCILPACDPSLSSWCCLKLSVSPFLLQMIHHGPSLLASLVQVSLSCVLVILLPFVGGLLFGLPLVVFLSLFTGFLGSWTTFCGVSCLCCESIPLSPLGVPPWLFPFFLLLNGSLLLEPPPSVVCFLSACDPSSPFYWVPSFLDCHLLWCVFCLLVLWTYSPFPSWCCMKLSVLSFLLQMFHHGSFSCWLAPCFFVPPPSVVCILVCLWSCLHLFLVLHDVECVSFHLHVFNLGPSSLCFSTSRAFSMFSSKSQQLNISTALQAGLPFSRLASSWLSLPFNKLKFNFNFSFFSKAFGPFNFLLSFQPLCQLSAQLQVWFLHFPFKQAFSKFNCSASFPSSTFSVGFLAQG